MTPAEPTDTFLVPVMSQSIIPFLSDLSEELNSRGSNVVFFPQNKSRILGEVEGSIPSEHVDTSHLRGDPERAFEDLLEKYDIRSPRSLVIPQMVYDYEYTNPEHQPFLLGADEPAYGPYLNLLHSALDTFDRVFEEDGGGVPIQRNGAEVLRRALQRVADYHDVPSAWIGFSPINDRSSLYRNESVDWDSFESDFEVDMSPEDRRTAKAYVETVREQQPRIGSPEGDDGKSPIQTAAQVADMAYRLVDADRSRKQLASEWVLAKSRQAGKRLKGRVYRSLVDDRTESMRKLERTDYVFLPLQYPRESRVTVRASPYYDVGWFVEYLSRCLPHGYELVVKDHPRQTGALPIDTFRTIRRHAQFIHPALNAHDVIEEADAVVTVNNTVGYEALIRGKPVITAGSAFYGSDEYVHKIDDLDALPAMLADAVDSGGLSEEEVIEFAYRLLEGSYPGVWNDCDPQNVEVLADSILDYIRNQKD